jgi:catechol 2,3-dioxygenase-like lactoylglutathione lyase family enzyme
MKPKISLITLGVHDLARSRAFYRDGLGLPIEVDLPEVAMFRMEGTWLALFGREDLAEDAAVDAEGAGFPAFSLAHNVPSRADVDRLMGEARAAGAKVTKPAANAPWGGYSGYFADPDGFLWEIAWNPDIDLS